MNRIALLADVHWGHKSFSKKVFEDDIGYFEQVFFPSLLENSVQDVILAGDLIHNRNLSDNYIIQELKQRFFGWFERNCITLHILVGNHDTVFKNTIDYNFPRTNLKEFEYCKVYDEQRIVTISGYRFGFQPWIPASTPTDLIPADKIDILIGHFDISGAVMQGETRAVKGRDVSDFKDYKQVFTGHYHATSDYNNVKYIGAPYQGSFRDYNNKKGFWYLGSEYALEYVENVHSPKYLKLYYSEVGGEIKLILGGLSEDPEPISIEEATQLMGCHYFKFIIKQYDDQDILQKTFIKITENAYDRVDTISNVDLIDDFDISSFEDEFAESDLELIDIMGGYVENSTFNDKKLDKNIVKDKLKILYKATKEGEKDN